MLLSGCGGKDIEAPVRSGVTFTDDLGRTVTVDNPQRVAAMIGSFADIWCLAGGKETLAAAADDAWTSFDLGLDNTTANLGAIKTPSVETLLAAQPDFVLASCNTVSNVEMEETFAGAGITAAYFDVQNFEDYLRMLKICTEITGCEENYEVYGLKVQRQIEAAIERCNQISPTVLCIRATGVSCKVKGGKDNVLGEMLTDLGCVNVADGSSMLENLSLEAIIAADPDYIFAVLQGADSSAAQKKLENTLLLNPAWASLRAVKEGRFYTLDNSLYNLKPNARWGEAYEKLAEILCKK